MYAEVNNNIYIYYIINLALGAITKYIRHLFCGSWCAAADLRVSRVDILHNIIIPWYTVPRVSLIYFLKY